MPSRSITCSTKPASRAWCQSGRIASIAAAKCYAIDEYELLGVEREAGKPAFALMAERGTGRYVAALSSP
jgi:hypothetical protein